MECQIGFCTTPSGHRLAYSVAGTGPAIVRPPGWVTSLALPWQPSPLEAALGASHSFVTYDKVGCGLSTRERSEYTLAFELQCFTALVDHLQLDRFALWGVSHGGPVSIAFAAQHPERVTRLALYGTWATRRTVQDLDRALGALARASWTLGSRSIAEMFAPGNAAFAEYIPSLTAAADIETVIRLLEMNKDMEVEHLLPLLRCPVLVMHRRGDLVVPFQIGLEIAAAVPQAQFVPLEGDSHMPFIGDVQALVEPLVAFFSADDAAQPRHQTPAALQPAAKPVFISYAAEDRAQAEALCTALEAAGIACWIAPRDVPAGQPYAEAIVDAIDSCRVMLLVSAGSNRSPHVLREAEQAVSASKPLLPLRLEEVALSKSLRYFLSASQWVDAFPRPFESYLAGLVAQTASILTAAEAAATGAG